MPAWSIHRDWTPSTKVRLQHMIPETVSGELDQTDTPAAKVAEGISMIVDAFGAATGGKCSVFTHGNLSPESPAFLTLSVIPFAPRSAAPVPLPAEAVVDTEPAKPCEGCP